MEIVVLTTTDSLRQHTSLRGQWTFSFPVGGKLVSRDLRAYIVSERVNVNIDFPLPVHIIKTCPKSPIGQGVLQTTVEVAPNRFFSNYVYVRLRNVNNSFSDFLFHCLRETHLLARTQAIVVFYVRLCHCSTTLSGVLWLLYARN